MKKAVAFLTLIALLAMIGGTVYLHQQEASPNLNDLQPAFENIKAFVPETMQMPLAAGLGIFLLLAFLLSLAVLFERRAVPAIEKIAQPTPPPVADNSYLEELKQLQKSIAEAEAAQSTLKNQISELNADNNNLKVQLEKLSSSSSIDSKELETALSHGKNLEAELKLNAQKQEKIAADLQVARKESDKAAGHLKTAQADLEKKGEELIELRKQLETLNHELKSAQANLKGGKEAIPPAAYQILYLFQKEGRLIDLLSEDISELDDETLGGAIRPIHEGCRKLLADRLILERVLNEDEGSVVTLDEIDPESIKLSGRVPASGPYKGELIHRGWRLKECNLPELVDGWKGNVIAPAEIEIS